MTADGIRTAAGSDYWLASTLKKILSNEKYIGDALLQKTVTTDFLNKKRVANKGIVPQYYVENSHEAIIPRDLFLQVQEEMVRRARLEKRKNDIDCPARTLFETELQAAVMAAFNQMLAMKDEFLPGMKLAMERALSQDNSPKVTEVDKRLEALQKELLKKANAKQGFDELADEIDALREEKQSLLLEDANRAAMKQRLDELEAFLTEQQEPVTDYDEGLVRRLIERITVFDDRLGFEFKCGFETEVQM